MNPLNKIAFDTTKEIMISFLDGASTKANKENGESVADMFEAIYTRLSKITKDTEVK